MERSSLQCLSDVSYGFQVFSSIERFTLAEVNGADSRFRLDHFFGEISETLNLLLQALAQDIQGILDEQRSVEMHLVGQTWYFSIFT